MQFTLGMYGDGDFYSMKGVVEEFLEKAGLHEKESYDPAATGHICIPAARRISCMQAM